MLDERNNVWIAHGMHHTWNLILRMFYVTVKNYGTQWICMWKISTYYHIQSYAYLCQRQFLVDFSDNLLPSYSPPRSLSPTYDMIIKMGKVVKWIRFQHFNFNQQMSADHITSCYLILVQKFTISRLRLTCHETVDQRKLIKGDGAGMFQGLRTKHAYSSESFNSIVASWDLCERWVRGLPKTSEISTFPVRKQVKSSLMKGFNTILFGWNSGQEDS